ncbi:hypothetical protein KFU94_41815 [Chloroflexi bacterium TSY]|nr:hypothetical protein [Chloroflexi bacterium TSY]
MIKSFVTFLSNWLVLRASNLAGLRLTLHKLVKKGHSVSRSHRALANRWLAILWKMWQDRTTYDESFHIRQRTIRRRPQA